MATAAGSGPHLELYHDSKHTSSFNLAGASSWTIGRSLECSVVINHPSVSRLHAQIYEEDGGFYLTDMGSTHGTRLAEQALEPKQPVRLVDGVRVSIGSTERSLVPRGMLAQSSRRRARRRRGSRRRRRRGRRRRRPPTTTRLRRAARAPRTPRAPRCWRACPRGGGPAKAAAEARPTRTRASGWGFRSTLGSEGDPGRRTPALSAAAPRWRDKGKKGGVQMAAKLGTGLNVPAATPTLVALQERKAAEAAEEAASAAKQKKQAAAPKVIGAMAPARGPPAPRPRRRRRWAAVPPGWATRWWPADAAAGAGADDGAFVGPPMPPECRRCGRGRRRAAAAARGGGRRRLRSGRPQPAGDAERQRRRRRRRGRGDSDDDDDDSRRCVCRCRTRRR